MKFPHLEGCQQRLQEDHPCPETERTGYRRAVDKAYGDLVDAIAMLESANALAGLRPMLASLPDKIRMDRHDAEAEAALKEATQLSPRLLAVKQ